MNLTKICPICKTPMFEGNKYDTLSCWKEAQKEKEGEK